MARRNQRHAQLHHTHNTQSQKSIKHKIIQNACLTSMNRARSLWSLSGTGRFQPGCSLASHIALAPSFPPRASANCTPNSSVLTWSRVSDRTAARGIARWQPEQARHTSTPWLVEAHSGFAAPQSAHVGHCCRNCLICALVNREEVTDNVLEAVAYITIMLSNAAGQCLKCSFVVLTRVQKYFPIHAQAVSLIWCLITSTTMIVKISTITTDNGSRTSLVCAVRPPFARRLCLLMHLQRPLAWQRCWPCE